MCAESENRENGRFELEKQNNRVFKNIFDYFSVFFVLKAKTFLNKKVVFYDYFPKEIVAGGNRGEK